MPDRAEFRFYEALNDFLPTARRKVSFAHAFAGTPAVVDVVEAIGVPHTEIDLILVDGASVGFDYRLRGGERVTVYPLFESLDIAPLVHLRPEPLREPRFILDVHLGRLAHYIRLLAFGGSMRPTTKTRKSPRAQLAEVVAALDLRVKFKPFTRCMACNGALEVVAKEVVAERLPPQIR